MNQSGASDNKKRLNRVLFVLFILFVGFRFYADFIRVKDAFFMDLRNRVTGTRLLKQDTTPYYFKWTPAYPMTLYDPFDRCNITNNMTTAPPSLLLLMEPLAPLPYPAICRLWIGLHYVAFLLMMLAIYYSFKDPPARNLVLLAGTVLLLSDPWSDSVFKGQSHFLFAAITAISIWMVSSRITYRLFYAGLVLAFLIWLRPNALVILPFLMLCQTINRKHLLAGWGAGMLLFGIITLLLNHQHYWLEFYQTSKEWINHYASGIDLPMCHFTLTVEGQTFKAGPNTPRWQPEITDLFHLIKFKLRLNINATYLTVAFFIVYIVSIFSFYKRRPANYTYALFAGVLLYWFSEMTAPLLRMSYYYVEMFVLILFLTGNFRNLPKSGKVLLIASFVFMFLKPLPMNLMTAELCTIACAVTWLLRKPFLKTNTLS